MVECATCGTENAIGSRFCSSCGTPLGTPQPPLLEERKVVSALFCDLVGFTATSEAADPEDVDRMLTTYFEMARGQIESYGGVVEKFIGDAVLGVFGVPAAHEDDPERAVRAALRICEEAAGLQSLGDAPLRLRVGVNTGEVLVRLGIAPGSGERFLAGDTINTASRIQSVAPELGVAVGLATYEATKAVFGYVELPPATLKGKAEPVRVFQPSASRARLGVDLTRTHSSAYVGREIDLALLEGLFDKSVAASSVQLVTVVGEPGIGKSRIVAELLAHAQSRAPRLTWRQGRCLPYGDGITFWALGEIVKAHAGILESDAAAVAEAKLDDVLPQGDERPWFRQRLLPLLGIEATTPAAQDELFTAWRRFLEHLAKQRATVLVFEDLHWADVALLAFLEHLADRAEGVPLLVVGTARPELFEQNATFGSGAPNASRINLAPLTESETSRLVSGLLGAAVPPELAGPILERSEGNPLYAEEFVRLLRDRDLVVDTDRGVALRPGAAVPLPDSIQALITARLDTLSPERKSMLADAATVGKVFWAGALVAMGGRDLAEVTDAMRELSRKELVRPARHSSMEGEAEYAFWHVLARDVAYGSLPRASRAARHVAAARWIESKAADRLEDRADVLAHHYGTALDLALAAGRTALAADLEGRAFQFLSLAGERALSLDTAAALASLERALALVPAGRPERAAVLARFGEAALQAGRYADAKAALEEAIASFRSAGEIADAARAMGTLSLVLSKLGDPRQWTLPREALGLLEPLGPSPGLVAALTEVARAEALQYRSEDALRVAARAIELAEDLGLPRPARALGYRGMARTDLGDAGGLTDFREAIELAIQAEQAREVANLYNNLASRVWPFEGPGAYREVMREEIAYAKPRGLTAALDVAESGLLDELVDTGQHDEALALAASMVPRLDASADVWDLLGVRDVQARILALRGKSAEVAEVLDWLESSARASGDPLFVLLGLSSAALARAGLGQGETAAALLREIEADPGARANPHYAGRLGDMVRTALGIGEADLAEQLVAGYEPRTPFGEHALVTANAMLAEARGDLAAALPAYADAAERWLRFEVVAEQGYALLGLGRCLVGLGRHGEALRPLAEAREIFARLGAVPTLAETDALLEQARAA